MIDQAKSTEVNYVYWTCALFLSKFPDILLQRSCTFNNFVRGPRLAAPFVAMVTERRLRLAFVAFLHLCVDMCRTDHLFVGVKAPAVSALVQKEVPNVLYVSNHLFGDKATAGEYYLPQLVANGVKFPTVSST